jgi:hypothetical protein
MNGIKVRIINNLKGRVHPVADHIALSGIDDPMDGMEALQTLQKEGAVEVECMNIALPGYTPVYKKFYTLSFAARTTDHGLRRVK